MTRTTNIDDCKVAKTVKTIMEAAKEAFCDDKKEQYISQVKTKLNQLATAKKVVRNIERELTDLEIDIKEALS